MNPWSDPSLQLSRCFLIQDLLTWCEVWVWSWRLTNLPGTGAWLRRIVSICKSPPPPQPCNTPHLQYFQHIDDFIKGFLKSTSIFQFVCCIVPRTSLNWILHYNNQFRLLRIFCLQQEQWYHEIWSLYDSLCTFWSVENSMINIVTLMKCKCSNLLSHFKYFGLHFIIGSCLQYIGSSRQYISIGN